MQPLQNWVEILNVSNPKISIFYKKNYFIVYYDNEKCLLYTSCHTS